MVLNQYQDKLNIKKVVLPAAGLGTRLLPITKETPKEMLPIYIRGENGNRYLKPVLQVIFEQLYDNNFREFIFIVGRSKRAIEDHFTIDNEFIKTLYEKNKSELATEMEKLYNKIEKSSLIFVNQPEPKGFGDSILKVRSIIEEEFLVHAGDTYIKSSEDTTIKKVIESHNKYKSEITFASKIVKNPKDYGVVTKGKELENNVFHVNKVIEKPDKPETNLAIMPIYIFSPNIFEALEEINSGVNKEIQLTDGIQNIINKKLQVNTVVLDKNDVQLDIGNPENFWEAVKLSYNW